MQQIISDFIWLRPLWLAAIPAILLWLWYLSNREQRAGWNNHIDSTSLQHLRIAELRPRYYRYFTIPLIVACIALSGPALISMPTVTANSERATVLILDLSPSMLARDIKPDRLSQAKYKAIDLLRQYKEGEIGLIVYAANAYRVTPLTDDPATIEALIPTLHPDSMPAAGSNTESAITMALDMLSESGGGSGEIVLVTDGIAQEGLTTIAKHPAGQFRLSILGVGTDRGSTIPFESGVLTDDQQQPVIAKLNSQALRSLTQRYGGRYASWTTDSSDIQHIAFQKPWRNRLVTSPDTLTGDEPIRHFDRYQDLGYWLIMPLLLCAIYAFRKNAIFTIFPLLFLSPEAQSIEPGALWKNLWQNSDQQAKAHLDLHNYELAYRQFTRNEWKAISAYHLGQYDEAVRLLETPVYAEDLYNRGNAQAMSGDLPAAIKSYNRALLLYGTDDSIGRSNTLHNLQVAKIMIDNAQEPDTTHNRENTSDKGAGRDEGNAQTQESDQAEAEAQSTQTQSRVGGSTGPGQSLSQQALQQNDGENSRLDNSPDVNGALATDATERLTQTAATTTESASHTTPTTAPGVPENSNLVLSPYSEQWLRDLPKDPGGYLRRKFMYLHQTRQSADKNEPAAATKRRY